MEEKQNGEILRYPDIFPPISPWASCLGCPFVFLTLSEVSLGPGHANVNYQPASITQTTCSFAAIMTLK